MPSERAVMSLSSSVGFHAPLEGRMDGGVAVTGIDSCWRGVEFLAFWLFLLIGGVGGAKGAGFGVIIRKTRSELVDLWRLAVP